MVGKNLVGQWIEPGGAGGGYNYGGFSIRLQANGAFFLGVYWYAAEPTVFYPWEESRTGAASPSSEQCWAADLSASACTFAGTHCISVYEAHVNCTLRCDAESAPVPVSGQWAPAGTAGRNVSYCQASTQQSVSASYGYSRGAGGPAASFESGFCFYGGSVCTGKVLTRRRVVLSRLARLRSPLCGCSSLNKRQLPVSERSCA